MKYLFVGGSFDPIHLGHLIVARNAAEYIGAGRVVLVPSAMKAHKRDKTIFEHRYEMCKRAVDGDDFFAVSNIEQEVLAAKGDSYTYAVVETIAERLVGNAQLGPVDKVNWLIGADSIPKAVKWRFPERLRKITNFVVASRMSWDNDTSMLTDAGYDHMKVPVSDIDISSTMIRERIARRHSIKYLVPDAVANYISRNHLYGHL